MRFYIGASIFVFSVFLISKGGYDPLDCVFNLTVVSIDPRDFSLLATVWDSYYHRSACFSFIG